MFLCGHVGIHGNEAAATAANEAVHKKPTDDLMPFSDLKSLTAKYIHQVWQKEWDEAVTVSNKLHGVLPKLSDKLLPLCKTRKGDTVSFEQTTYWSFLFGDTVSFEQTTYWSFLFDAFLY